MTERRPHWDDSLVESVIHAISDYFDDEYRAYAVIAAVEDWQVANARDRVYLAEPTSAEQAAIARVRELHGRLEVTGLSGPSFVCLECYDAEWPCATIRALDGDGDE